MIEDKLIMETTFEKLLRRAGEVRRFVKELKKYRIHCITDLRLHNLTCYRKRVREKNKNETRNALIRVMRHLPRDVYRVLKRKANNNGQDTRYCHIIKYMICQKII